MAFRAVERGVHYAVQKSAHLVTGIGILVVLIGVQISLYRV
jgi:hypothetical protein